ncbi:MAG: histidine phosphatase family protein [Oscillospiraceae bacterium]|nr:histidine phosphatase family protein [Oscillospiraceae bacterium]MBQ8979689.1 histidine phosphatase family protein [Oscillospiraceae bacterium]
MRLLFIRHGDPDYQNDCLTPTGHEQAEKAAHRLASENIDKIYASCMGRARQTAGYTARLTGKDVEILDFMREIVWGYDEDYQPEASPWVIADKMADEGMDAGDPMWEENRYFKGNRCVDNVHMIAEEFDKLLLTLGYRREGGLYRCITDTDNDRTVALFSHGGSSSAAMSHILGIPFPLVCSTFHLDLTSVCVLRFDSRPGSRRMPVIELLNDARHIHMLTNCKI